MAKTIKGFEVHHEHLGDIASSKYLMNRGKLLRLVRGKVWGKWALLSTPPSEQLACSIGG